MKKLLILLLSICMIGSIGTFASCKGSTETSSSSSVETVETIEDKVRSSARIEVRVDVYLKYGYFPTVNITNVSESYTENNKYYVSGKYTVKDNYGDAYTGKFDVTVVYDPETEQCDATETEIQTAYKD